VTNHFTVTAVIEVPIHSVLI